MFNVVIFGAPGSGKGTQSERLINEYGLYHISTGEVLREHIANGTELGKIADSYISQGQLIPDNLMVDILDDLLEKNQATRDGVIFDGFPRTVPQAHALNEMLARRGSKVHAVVGLEVGEEELVKRILKRDQETGRADDNLDTVKKRLDVYHSQTSPLRDLYIAEGKYHGIDGTGSVESIFKEIKTRLDKEKND